MNTLMIIEPYCKNGTWMFDDAGAGLREEPFIAGIPEIIEFAAAKAGIENPKNGFRLLFSATPFPGYQAILRLADELGGGGGKIYQLDGTDMQGWCVLRSIAISSRRRKPFTARSARSRKGRADLDLGGVAP